MPHYLVSGGAGFIGSHLCDALLAQGHSVVAADNLITGNRRNLADAERTGGSRFRFVELDVASGDFIRGLPDTRFDGVFHLASLASPVDYMREPIETLKSGSYATHNMLDLARRDGARFLVTSTSEVYGDPLVHPQREDYWGNVNPVGPRSCYDESKRYAEAVTMTYRRAFGLETRIARIFNTYGPRMQLKDGRVVPAFVDQALHGEPITVFGDGTQTRSFCYVADLVRGLIALFESSCADPVNLGNPDERTMLEFAVTVQRLTGTRSEIVYRPLPQDDPKRRRPDITRAREVLGWQPEVALEDGLRETIRYFQTVIETAV